jgi:4'-phosphopantetheinyl transferase
MILLYYAYPDILLKNNYNSFIELLPLQIKSKLSRLKRNEDKQLGLTSLVLLSQVLNENGFGNFRLSDLQIAQTGRPFFTDAPFDFNISHTEGCAAVVFSRDCRIGIDIEKIKEIDFSDFKDFFTNEQWEDIYSADNKFKRFYYYWTLIESGVKADGGGLSLISDKNIEFIKSSLFINKVRWFYNHYDFDPSISCCITTDKENGAAEIRAIRNQE